MNCCDRFPKKSFVLLLSLVLCGLIFAQGLRIENANVRGRGGREITFYRPHAPEDAWWYSSDVECVHDVGCVDVVFCMDTSGSMAGTINNLQDEIDRFAYNIASVGFGYAFGLVTYSETVNFPHGSTLVEDLGAFSAILDEARSGDGGWEHHSDAIYQAIMNFNWRPGCEHVVVLISDECDDASTVTPSATIAQILSWGGFVYILSGDCGDVDDFRDYCDTSNGKWFNYSTSTLNDVFDQIVDDIADVVEINITVTNTSGGAMNPITATLIPDFCIMVGDSPNPQPYGPVPNGASHTFVWDVEEIPGCAGWGDCFMIRVAGGAYVDSIVGCLWVEDCGCPGPEAVFVCPEGSGNWTACRDQYIEIEYVGYIGVDPNSLCIRVNGVNHCYPASPNLTWTPGFRGGTLRFTPTPPGWNHLQTVNVQCLSGNDATGCPQRFFPESNFRVDIKPPRPIWWEHHDATWWPPSPAWREAHDGSVSWQPACGSTVDDTTHIIIYALLHDDGVGMTPLDAILSSLDFSELAGLDFIGLWTSLTSINVTVNGIPFVPGFPIPGHFSRTVDLDYATYLLHPASWFGGWAVACTIRADSAGILGLAFLTGGEIEICLNANDLVEASGCMPCDNDTQWCCTYYLSADLPLVANAGPDQYICSGSSVIIGGTPAAGGGTEPYNYSWSPSTGLSNPNIANPIASPTTTTTYTLTVTDAASGVATDNMTVYVSNPVANAGPDDTLCAGSYVMLGGSPTGSGGFPPLSYSWQPAGLLASPTSANPMFITSMSWGDTSFTFIVTVTDTLGCTDVDTVRIVIDNVDADAGPDQRVCLGGSVTLGGSPTASGGVPPYTYHWYEYPGGAMISTDPNPVVTPSATTTYVVQINGGEPYCMAADTCIVYVVEVFADAGPDQSVCLGSSVTIGGSPTASGSGGYSYSWISVPAGFVSAISNPMVSPTGNTRYIVTVIDSIGCTDVDTVFVEVFPAPFGWVSVPSFCGGVTSCAYQSIIWTIVDTVGTINEASIRISVDGTVYTVASPEVTTTAHIGDSLSIMFSPGSSWPHGDTIVFELINVASFAGCSTFVAPCSFIVDIEPPIADPLLPADGSTVFVVPDSVGAFISDFPAGVDPLSFNYITITVNGLPATGWTYTWTGGYLGFNNLVLSEGDSVVICLDSLFDDPDYDYCAHNDTSLCWWFMIMPCDVEVTASPDTVICGNGDIVLNADVEGGSGFFTYDWRPAVGLDDPTLPNPTAIVESTITYVVEVYDESLMCSAYDTATIIVSNPIANAGPDGIICPFSIVPLGCNPAVTGGLPPYSFEWINSTGAVIYTVENPLHSFGDTDEWFVLHVVDSLGCEAWDTVFFDVDVEEITSFDFISPLPDDTLPAGEVYFEWEVEPSGGYLYDFILDGAVVFSRIDSNHVTLDFPCGESHFWTVVVWRECFHGYVACEETTSTVFIDSLAYPFDPPFHMEDCGEPYAVAVHVPDGDWTACNPDSIVAYIIDSVGIIESSIVMTVNGTEYTTVEPELTWDGDSTLVFRPGIIWSDGEIVSVCVDSAMNVDSMPLIAPVCWEFYIDRSAPQIVSISPTPFSEIPTTVSTVRVCVRDMLSGLDSLIIDVDGVLYELGAFGCVDTVVCYDFPIGPLSPGDVVDVNLIRATDCPDWCGPNVLDSVWDYLVSDCDVEITFDLGVAETLICHPDSMPVVFELTTTVTGGTAPFTYWNSMEGIVGPTHVGDPTYNLDHSTLISIIVVDADSCVDTASFVVYISDLEANAGPDLEICEGDTVQIGRLAYWWSGPFIGAVDYWWTYEDGTFLSDELNPLVWPDVTTSYVFHVSDSAGCEDTDTMTVIRNHESPGTFTGLYPPPDAMLPPGDITIVWSDAGGVPPANYHLIIDGADTVAMGIADTFFTVNYPCGHTHSWEVIAFNLCASEFVAYSDSGEYDSIGYEIPPDTFYGGIDTSGYDPIFHTHPCETCAAWIDTVWFSEETDCDSLNTVEICYVLSSDCPDSVYPVSIELSPGDGATWPIPLDSIFEAEGDLGDSVIPGLHCFYWEMSEDWPGEEGTFLIRATTGYGCCLGEDLRMNGTPREVLLLGEFAGESFSLDASIDYFEGDVVGGETWFTDSVDSSVTISGLGYPGTIWFNDRYGWASSHCYTHFYICAPFDTTVHLRCRPDDDLAVWLDGTLIFEEHDHVATIFHDVPLELVACEWHSLYLWNYDSGGPNNLISFYFSDALDNPIDWLHTTLSPSEAFTTVDTAYNSGPLDSRPPVTLIDCPTFPLVVGIPNTFEWLVEDSFWVGDICSLHFFGCDIDEEFTTVDTFLSWTPPSPCSSCTLAIAVRDSFCNWGYDTCVFEIDSLSELTALIIEPLPNTISACEDQEIVMEIFSVDAVSTSGRVLWLSDLTYGSGRLSGTGAIGYSHAAESLAVWGWTVDEIAQTVVLTSGMLEDYDVVVIGNVKSNGPRIYTAAERTVLTAFVANGGKLLAISGWVVEDYDIIMENFLLGDIGVYFEPYEDWTSFVIPEPGSPIEPGVTQVPGNGCKWIVGLDECWGSRGSDCAVGVKRHGAGVFVGYFDEHWLFNGPWHSMDFTTHQNATLFRNIFSYLAPMLDSILCPIDPSSIVLRVEGIDYTVSDPEMDWSDPILTWTPPVDWIHGTSVEVCLTAAEDSCGGEAEGLPICWEFEIDLEPPVVVSWNPPCSSAVNPSSGVDFNISLEDGPANIGSVWISVNGTDFDLGSALTISGSNADFVWNPVVDGGITLIPGSSFEFCVHASDTNINYCENHDTVYCCEYFVTSDTGVVTGIIIEPLPNTITTCDDQAIVMEIMGSETTFRTKNLLWLTDNGYSSGRLSDASLTGYSNAAESLSVWGWNVDEICQATVLTSALVEGYDVIVIGNIKTDGPRAYTSAERTLLTDFVASGGKVLAISGWVVADHDINLENFLLADIGVSFTPFEMWTSYVPPEPGSPIEGGVTQVPGNGCKWIIGLDECWAYRGSDCAVGVKHHGAGAVVGYFDEHWLFNGPWHSMDFTTHQNTRLFRNIMEYLESSLDSTDCPIDPSSIILRVEGTDYTVADAELDWTPSQLTFTPSVLWTHGQVVDVCLVQAEDSCGAVLEDSICWQFTVDLEPPALASIVPACGSPIIPLINDHWDITLIDIPAGVMPDSTFVILGDDTCHISGGGGTFSFTFDPDDYGIILVPGDTITLCIRSMDGPVDYCEPNDTIYCCDYPIFPSEGPIAYPVRVPPDSISACEPESIIIEITSEFEVVESTIVLNVDGIDYRTFNPELTWLDPFLTYLPNPDWNPHDTVFVQLVSARDIFENQYVNYPLEWVFYIDRVEPQSAMIEPPEFTRDIWHQIVITLSDQLAGVNPNSLILEVEGIEYHYPGDFDWNSSGLGGSIVWNPVQHGVEYNAGDTIDVRIYAEDDPDLCLPNVHTAEYSFIVEPWTPCMVNPNPFSPNGDNINEITTFDWPNMTTEAAVIYIFDIRNILVRKLDIEPQRNYLNYPARAWDGYDSEGKQMPQGLYLYVIESDGRIVCNGTITLVR